MRSLKEGDQQFSMITFLRRAPVVVVGSGIAAIAIACGGGDSPSTQDGNQYPKPVITNFMDSCEAAGSDTTACTCAIHEIQNNYSIKEFTNMEKKILETGDIPQDLLDTISNCQ